MKINTKLAGLFLIPMIAGSIGLVANAAEEHNNCDERCEKASEVVEARLEDNLCIKAKGHSPIRKIDCNGDLDGNLFADFDVTTNCKRDLDMKAKIKVKGGHEEEAFFEQDGKVFILLANTECEPEREHCDNCKTSRRTDDADKKANVIAYEVEKVTKNKEALKVRDTFKKDEYKFDVKEGKTDVECFIGRTCKRGTFGKEHKPGIYKATITLSKADI